MASLFEQQLRDLLNRVKIPDKKTVEFDQQQYPLYKQSTYTNYTGSLAHFGANKPEEDINARNAFIQHVGQLLYAHGYCGISPENAHHPLPTKKERSDFMNTLSVANHTPQTPDKSWQVYSIDQTGNAFAKKNGQLRPAPPNSYVPLPHQQPLTVNQKIDFYRQKENREAQPVFYYVYGETYLAPDTNMMRIYWNIIPEGAPTLVYLITKVLNNYRIPFSFKCLNHDKLYNRNDCAVLYFDKTNLEIIRLLIDQIVVPMQPYLRQEPPLFTQPIHPGVTLAEDPGDGQSFGTSRTAAIAEALVMAYEEKLTEPEAIYTFVLTQLEKCGMPIDRIYLNPHTTLYTKQPSHA